MNIDGATAVIYGELRFAAPLARGIFCLSRALGILSHAWEQSGRKDRNKGQRVEAQSAQAKVPVAVCVIEIHGNIIVKHRMSGAPTFSLELSERKAYTSALVGLRTADLSPLVQPGQALFSLMGVAGGRFCSRGAERRWLSTVSSSLASGISGGTVEQDVELLEAGLREPTVADVIDAENERLEFAHVGMDDGAATLDSPINPSNSDRVKGGSMLKSIDPLLNADVLYALRSMGHGDDLVLCDTNFPADSVARQTVLGRLLRIDNVSAGRAARAILSVLPLDSFVDKPASRMEIVGQPGEIPEVQREVQAAIDAAEGRSFPMGSVERFAFYELARKSYCVIQTGERRFYGCFIFKKGVIPPDA